MKKNNVIQFPLKNRASTEPVRSRQPAASHRAGPLSELDVWQALAEDRVLLHYQPQFGIDDEQLMAVEALVRLRDETGVLIYPGHFIEMAENSGMIVPLGRRVIALACQHMADWREQQLPVRHVSINLSARQLEIDSDLLDFVHDCLHIHELNYSDLEFELTERQHLMPDNHGKGMLMELARLGSRIVIDDFGVGYGSNLYLTELPVSAFKLDIAMTRRLGEDAATTSVIKHLLLLASDLGIDVVAEGVETRAHHELLREFGCTFGQGYHYARPMSHSSLAEFVNVTISSLPGV